MAEACQLQAIVRRSNAATRRIGREAWLELPAMVMSPRHCEWRGEQWVLLEQMPLEQHQAHEDQADGRQG